MATTLSEAWKMKRVYGKEVTEPKSEAQLQYESLLKGLKKKDERKNKRNV
ncbi:MAG: hypothetical protein ABIH23_05090 [bacterium]